MILVSGLVVFFVGFALLIVVPDRTWPALGAFTVVVVGAIASLYGIFHL